MKKIQFVLPILLSVVGTLAVIGGEIDDSPGLGGIGLILIAISTYWNFKLVKKNSNT